MKIPYQKDIYSYRERYNFKRAGIIQTLFICWVKILEKKSIWNIAFKNTLHKGKNMRGWIVWNLFKYKKKENYLLKYTRRCFKGFCACNMQKFVASIQWHFKNRIYIYLCIVHELHLRSRLRLRFFIRGIEVGRRGGGLNLFHLQGNSRLVASGNITFWV